MKILSNIKQLDVEKKIEEVMKQGKYNDYKQLARLANMRTLLKKDDEFGGTHERQTGWEQSKNRETLGIIYNTSSNKWKFNWMSQGQKGDISDFVTFFYGLSFKETIVFLNEFDKYDKIELPSAVRDTANGKSQKRKGLSKKINNKYDNMYQEVLEEFYSIHNMSLKHFEYLLNRNVLNSLLTKAIVENKIFFNEWNIIFNMNYEGFSIKGTNKEKPFVKILTEDNNTVWFEINTLDKEEIEGYIYFESIMDLFSYYTLYKKFFDEHNYKFIALNGCKHNILKESYKDTSKKLIIASDNDKSGNNFYSKVVKEFSNAIRSSYKTDAKDYNEELDILVKENKIKLENWEQIETTYDVNNVKQYLQMLSNRQNKIKLDDMDYIIYVYKNIIDSNIFTEKEKENLTKIKDEVLQNSCNIRFLDNYKNQLERNLKYIKEKYNKDLNFFIEDDKIRF